MSEGGFIKIIGDNMQSKCVQGLKFGNILAIAFVFSHLIACDNEQEDNKTLHESSLEAFAVVNGTVNGPNGNGVKGAKVFLFGTPDQEQTTDAAGEFQLKLSADKVDDPIQIVVYDAQALDGSIYGLQTKPIKLHSDLTKQNKIQIILRKTGAIEGSLELLDSPTKSGVEVSIPGTVFQTQTDELGKYRLEHLPIGRWGVEIKYPSFKTNQSEPFIYANVDSGETTSLANIILYPSNGKNTFFIKVNKGSDSTEDASVSVDANIPERFSKMRVSRDLKLAPTPWTPAKNSFKVDLNSEGKNVVELQFATEDLSEISEIFTHAIYFRDLDKDGVSNALDCQPTDAKFFEQVTYSFIDKDSDGYYVGRRTA